MTDIKEPTDSDYEVTRILAKLELNSGEYSNTIRQLALFFHNITIVHGANVIRVMMPIGELSAISKLSNKDCVEMVLAELKKYLTETKKITIIEQRMPFDSVSYCLQSK